MPFVDRATSPLCAIIAWEKVVWQRFFGGIRVIQKATLHHRAEWRRHCLVYRLFAVLIALLLLLPLLTACSGEEEEASEIAAYGEEGARFARKLAATFPRRVPYSDQESGAADLIMEELRK